MEFKGDQKAAFEAIKIFINQAGGGMFLLDGFAGTGKSYMTNHIVKFVHQEKHLPIAITTPTHKALHVLRNFMSIEVDAMTIHSALGLREEIDAYGRQLFVPNWKYEPKIASYQFVVVDEASMLHDDLFTGLLNYTDHGMKILFIGDSLQIPPVNNGDALPFDKGIRLRENIGYFKMEQIIRQGAGNPIIEHSFKIRQNIYRPIPIILRKNERNEQGSVTFVPYNNELTFIQDKILPLYTSDEFKENVNHVKILAWRNKTVNYYNDLIRQYIYGQEDLAKILPGERLTTTEPLVEDKQVLIHNNEDMTVESYTIEEDHISEDWILTYYKTVVNVDRPNNPYTQFTLRIIHEDSEELFEEILELQRKHALSFKQGTFEAKSAWMDYYEFKKEYHAVKYSYAITAHRSQGSTYNTAVVLERDIDTNRKTYEKNRIFYTACTRPSENLYVIY